MGVVLGVFSSAVARPPQCLNKNGLTAIAKKKGACSSSIPPATPARTMKSIVHSTRHYDQEIPAKFKVEIYTVEEDAKVEQSCAQNEEVRKEFEALLPDPGYPWGRVSLYLKTLGIAWNQKYIMGKSLVERGEAHEAILLQFDELTMNLHQIVAHLGIQLNDNQEAPSSLDIKMKPG